MPWLLPPPDHWHAQVAVDAAKAGKDIYCEKPMASTIAEGRAMVNATRKYDRVFQTGNMQRSWRDFRHAVELVRNGYIGQITEINVNVGEPVKQCDLPSMEPPQELDWNEWVGPSLYRGWNPTLAPLFGDDKWAWWRGYRDFGGGLITDWGAHMFDIAQWGLDMDKSGPVQFLPPSVSFQNRAVHCGTKMALWLPIKTGEKKMRFSLLERKVGLKSAVILYGHSRIRIWQKLN